MACLSAEISANNQLFIQEDQKKAWVLNEELYDRCKYIARHARNFFNFS